MSSINPNNINGQFPIAGQDNDSQGFRDNFTNVKNNLTFAKSEIEDLQQNAILKTPLSGTTLNNEMNNSQLKGVQMLRFSETIKDLTSITGAFAINWEEGHYQFGALAGNTTLTFENWITSGFHAKLRLELYVSSAAVSGGYAVTFSTSGVVYRGLSDIQGVSTNVFTPTTAGYYVFDFSTRDNGATIYVEDALRNYDNVSSDFSISGALTTSGAVIAAGTQYANSNASFGNLVSGNTFVVNSTVSRVILAPSSTFDSLYITLPANVNAKTIRISSTAAITNVVVSGPAGTTVAPSGNITLAAGVGAEYQYLSSTGTWYKS
jgi:hypothetical protein